MRVVRFTEPDRDFNPVERVVTEEEIRRDYFPQWSAICADHPLHSHLKDDFEACLEDFSIIHWGVIETIEQEQ